MERLTIPDKKIDGGVRRAFIDTKAVKENAMTIYWALKKYEDTGLTPEQIMELKERKMTRKEKEICKKYSARDENGLVHCKECPLVVDSDGFMCKANSRYNRKTKEWERSDNHDGE